MMQPPNPKQPIAGRIERHFQRSRQRIIAEQIELTVKGRLSKGLRTAPRLVEQLRTQFADRFGDDSELMRFTAHVLPNGRYTALLRGESYDVEAEERQLAERESRQVAEHKKKLEHLAQQASADSPADADRGAARRDILRSPAPAPTTPHWKAGGKSVVTIGALPPLTFDDDAKALVARFEEAVARLEKAYTPTRLILGPGDPDYPRPVIRSAGDAPAVPVWSPDSHDVLLAISQKDADEWLWKHRSLQGQLAPLLIAPGAIEGRIIRSAYATPRAQSDVRMPAAARAVARSIAKGAGSFTPPPLFDPNQFLLAHESSK